MSLSHARRSILMADLSPNAKCCLFHTAFSIRTNVFQSMSDAGFEPRHITYMGQSLTMQSRYDSLVHS